MLAAPSRPVFQDAPLPADPEFVARVRREIEDADARAYESLGRQKPKPKPEPPAPEPEQRVEFPTPKPKARGRMGERARERARVREEVILCLLCGQTQKETAASLGLAVSTVSNHLDALRVEYGARNVHHLAALAAIELMEQMVETRDKLIREYEFRDRLHRSA